MSLFHANAGQAEIIRSVQKDQEYIENIRSSLSEMLLLLSHRQWFKYNAACKLIAEIMYHHYAILNNLQTLGEEYTGIIQVDANYVMLPNKALQLLAIILECGGEHLADRMLTYLDAEIDRSDELLVSVKNGLHKFIGTLRLIMPYVRGFHTSLFYINGGKYHISKRLTNINYVLIRNWLKENHSVYGYRLLGYVTLAQLILSLAARFRQQQLYSSKNTKVETSGRIAGLDSSTHKCALCIDITQNITVTQCGHLFCWDCILNWLDQKQVCPICREAIKKTRVVRLQNYFVEHSK
ncbi:peroxisome biogenesis factor 10 [Anopheles ziemanni]|uniref:peroxisome biogenesis factor 10 n=1 Tax=Anopheles coustani TaxID=139045 RepID=UPI002657AD31|nr:peroxisome biogenesis factor 10 [Anopheles coustani]XP_058176522.1 peroxisome biogenesis factor 10 [Anopheles ziemanni]